MHWHGICNVIVPSSDLRMGRIVEIGFGWAMHRMRGRKNVLLARFRYLLAERTGNENMPTAVRINVPYRSFSKVWICLLYTSDAADE